jgi:hypothetical protein
MDALTQGIGMVSSTVVKYERESYENKNAGWRHEQRPTGAQSRDILNCIHIFT